VFAGNTGNTKGYDYFETTEKKTCFLKQMIQNNTKSTPLILMLSISLLYCLEKHIREN